MVVVICPPLRGQLTNVPIHRDKSKRRDEAATGEHFKRTSMLARHVHDRELGCRLLPGQSKKN